MFKLTKLKQNAAAFTIRNMIRRLLTEDSNITKLINSSMHFNDFGARRDPLSIAIPVTIIYTLIFLIGIVGNVSTCIVIKKNRSMHNATNYYLCSLAISDLLLLVSGLPYEIFFIWSKYPYVFGEYICVGRGLLAEISANATVLTITAFTVERYVAICHPFRSQTMSKLNRAIRIVLIIWLCAILTAIPQAARFGIDGQSGIDRCIVVREIIEHSFQISTVIFFFVPMLIILILYLLIGLQLHRSNTIKSGDIADHRCIRTCHHRANTTRIYLKKKRGPESQSYGSKINAVCGRSQQAGTKRVVRMLIAVVICFFVCWAPFHAQRLVSEYIHMDTTYTSQEEVIYSIMTYVSGVLYYLSTCINPLLYNIMSKKFRNAFKAILFRKSFNNEKIDEELDKFGKRKYQLSNYNKSSTIQSQNSLLRSSKGSK